MKINMVGTVGTCSNPPVTEREEQNGQNIIKYCMNYTARIGRALSPARGGWNVPTVPTLIPTFGDNFQMMPNLKKLSNHYILAAQRASDSPVEAGTLLQMSIAASLARIADALEGQGDSPAEVLETR